MKVLSSCPVVLLCAVVVKHYPSRLEKGCEGGMKTQNQGNRGRGRDCNTCCK